MKIIIEFAHKNKTIEGIAYCSKPDCGYLATKRKEDNPEKHLFCKKCGAKVDKEVKPVYEQRDSTIHSIEVNIIPFLVQYYNATFEIIGNDHMTLLVIDLESNDYYRITDYFNGKTSFDSFEIPIVIYSSGKSEIIEFVGGLIDAAGFFNAGGWLMRTGEHNYGRMRGYFQIVRNWTMPVQICNLLKRLGFPIQTLDWGHPNIRDSSMKDYYDSNPLSWSREHQLKFFPEYYDEFPIRIEHKKNMFKELSKHNKEAGFYPLDDCEPPTPIPITRVKAYHHGEDDSRIHTNTRMHCDAFWQVCHNMGCSITDKKISGSKNKDYYFLTGEDNTDDDFVTKDKEYDERRIKLKDAITSKKKNKVLQKQKQAVKKKKSNPEQKLYDPIAIWLKSYLEKEYKEKILVHDTSAYYLDQFILQNNLFDVFDFCDEYKIKPDVVGFLRDSKRLVFVEVKIGNHSLQDVGQLLGYALVGLPVEAMLISPEQPSISLMALMKTNPKFLDYGDSRIKIGQWVDDKCVF